MYISGATVNGRNLTEPFVRWSDLNVPAHGTGTGTGGSSAVILEFWMSSTRQDPW